MEFINSTALPLSTSTPYHDIIYRGYSYLDNSLNQTQIPQCSNSDSFGFVQSSLVPSFDNTCSTQTQSPTDNEDSSYYAPTQLSGSYNSLKDLISTNSQNQIVYINPPGQDENQHEEYSSDDYDNEYYEQIKLELEDQLQQHQLQQNQLKQHQSESNINSRYSIIISDDDDDQYNNDTYLNYYLNN